MLPEFTQPPGLIQYCPPPLPGFALERLFHEAAPEVEAGPACRSLAHEMNRRGPADCREHVDLLVSNILPRARHLAAKRHPWAMQAFGGIGALGRAATDAAICARLHNYVLEACDLAECEWLMQ